MMRRRPAKQDDVLPSVSPQSASSTSSGYGYGYGYGYGAGGGGSGSNDYHFGGGGHTTADSNRLSQRKGAAGRSGSSSSNSGFAISSIFVTLMAIWGTLFLIAYLTNNDTLLLLLVPRILVNIGSQIQQKWHVMNIPHEPLPTIDDLHQILQQWHEESLSIDVESDIASKTPLPGPIPSLLWFPKCDQAYLSNVQKCQQNQDHTIRLYQETSYMSSTYDVKYLNDDECTKLLHTVEPKLVYPYEYEDSFDNKSAICRVAALYLHGGYFFDVELEVRVPFVDDGSSSGVDDASITSSSSSTTFVTAVMENGRGMFPAFLGSTPHHPVLEHALHQMVRYYDRAFKAHQYDDDKVIKKLAEEKESKFGSGGEGSSQVKSDEGSDKNEETTKSDQSNLENEGSVGSDRKTETFDTTEKSEGVVTSAQENADIAPSSDISMEPKQEEEGTNEDHPKTNENSKKEESGEVLNIKTDEENISQQHRRLMEDRMMDDDVHFHGHGMIADDDHPGDHHDYYGGGMYDDDYHFGVHNGGTPPVGYIDRSYMNELTQHDPGWRLGTHTLKQAFALLPSSAQGPTTLLHEINLGSVPSHAEDDASTYEQRQRWYPDVERRTSPEHKCCCNYVVHDPRTHIVHFYARFVGSTFC